MIPEPVLGAEDFTIIVLPDTQFYSCGSVCGDSDPSIFEAQTKWIVENKEVLNIVYVAHVGDIVEHEYDKDQWENASAAMSLLENPITTGLPDGIPYGMVPGNHDHAFYSDTSLYNTYFGIPRFKGRSYYGGSYGGSNHSNYTLFSAGGMDFIVINLDWFSLKDGLEWAEAKVKEFSDRRGIVVSHDILDNRGDFTYNGQRIYEALKDNPNVFLMLCGHITEEASRIDTFNNNTIYSLLADYQFRNGGDGWLRIMEFSPHKNEIRVKTYSPTLGQYETDADSQFTLSYDMGKQLDQSMKTKTGNK
jgi:hypothetical protein